MTTRDIHNRSLDEMMSLFETVPFRQMVAQVWRGLRAPDDSGAHKWAKLQLLRLWSPVSAVIVPILLVLIMVALTAAHAQGKKEDREVKIVPPEDPPIELVKPVDIPIVQPEEPDRTPDNVGLGIPDAPPAVATTPDPGPEPTEQTRPIGDIPEIHSTVTLKNLTTGQRGTPGLRRKAIADGGGVPAPIEGAIYRSLRWLKKHQEADGSWNTRSGMSGGNGAHPAGMTGLAVLTYLGHGELPAPDGEFGPTVQRALEWLLTHQAPDGGYARAYEHPIATYALCEAATMTRRPRVARAAARAVDIIVRGQNPSGGFNYGLQPCDRNDTSIMGWCAQALKAAQLAGVQNPGLAAAIDKSLAAFKLNYRGGSDKGGFGYTGPDIGKLTGVGVLCHQLLGQAKAGEVRGGLNHLVATDRFQWQGATWKEVYWWYYNTQARFHEGGECWKSWQAQFSTALIQAQVREVGAATAGKRQVDIGYWDTGNERGGRVMDTTLCTLTLEVYYRYLPSFWKTTVAATPEDDAQRIKATDIDMTVNVPDLDLRDPRSGATVL